MIILFVIITLIIAICIEQIIAKQKKLVNFSTISDVPVFSKSSIYAPEGYFISKYHTWAQPVGNALNVGIDIFAMKALGKILIKNIVSPGSLVKKGQIIMTGEVHSKQINFRSPVNGTIRKINNLLVNNSIKDAYGGDWIISLEENNGLTDLLAGKQAEHWLKKEMRRLKDFLALSSFIPEAAGVTLYDGGNIVEGALSSLSTDTIPDFEEQFLNGISD